MTRRQLLIIRNRLHKDKEKLLDKQGLLCLEKVMCRQYSLNDPQKLGGGKLGQIWELTVKIANLDNSIADINLRIEAVNKVLLKTPLKKKKKAK